MKKPLDTKDKIFLLIVFVVLPLILVGVVVIRSQGGEEPQELEGIKEIFFDDFGTSCEWPSNSLDGYIYQDSNGTQYMYHSDKDEWIELPEPNDIELVSGQEITDYEPCPTIFIGEGDSEVKLEWKNGEMVVTGAYEEGAKIFFEVFLKPMVDEYIKCKLEEGDYSGDYATEPNEVFRLYFTDPNGNDMEVPKVLERLKSIEQRLEALGVRMKFAEDAIGNHEH